VASDSKTLLMISKVGIAVKAGAVKPDVAMPAKLVTTSPGSRRHNRQARQRQPPSQGCARLDENIKCVRMCALYHTLTRADHIR
jgi:hypothetical protein